MDNDHLFEQPVELPESESEPHQPTNFESKSPRNFKPLIIVVLVVLVIGAVGFGAKQLLGNKSSSEPSDSNNQVAESIPEPETDTPLTTETKTYDNGPLGIALIYPADWRIEEGTDRGVRIVSPDFSYSSLTDQDVAGNFRIYIRKGARATDSKYIGRGVAILPSETLVYTNPALGQRSETLISFFGLDEAKGFNYFFIAGNFKLQVGDTLGPDYGKEPETFIIAGGYSSDLQEEDMDFTSVNQKALSESNSYKQAVNIIKSLELH